MPKVHIAVGHGRRDNGSFDPGAVGNGWTEQTAGDIIVARAAAVLSSHGLGVTHEADQDDPNFVGTVRDANRLDVDLLVSVHHDWTGGVDGTFGFWNPNSKHGERATRAIVAAAGARGFRTVPKWTKARGDLYVLNASKMPATLIECGRIGDASLDERVELEQMGEAVAEGVLRYFGIARQASAPKPAGKAASNADEAISQIARLVGHNHGTRWDSADYEAVVRRVKALT